MTQIARITNHLTDKQFMKYIIDMVVYVEPAQITSQCAAITFVNDGTATMTILGRSFAPGEGMAINGNDWELDTTKYTLNFTGAGTRVCTVIRKNYTG